MGAIEGPLPGGDRYRIRRRLPRLSWEWQIRDLGFDGLDVTSVLVDDLASLALLPLLLVVGFLIALLLPILLFAAELLLILLIVVPLGVLLVVVGVRRHLVLLVRERDDAVIRSALVRGPVASWRAGRRFAALVRDGRAEDGPPAFAG